MYFNLLVKELREIYATETPSVIFADRLTADLIIATQNLQPDEALAFATRIQNAAMKARELIAKQFLNNLPFNPTSGAKYNDGKNFTTDRNLVFRVNTKADFNFSQNDDIEPEYGMSYDALNALQTNLAEQSKLMTKLLANRKSLILFRHPRMTPTVGSVKHSISFLGTSLEVSNNIELNNSFNS